MAAVKENKSSSITLRAVDEIVEQLETLSVESDAESDDDSVVFVKRKEQLPSEDEACMIQKFKRLDDETKQFLLSANPRSLVLMRKLFTSTNSYVSSPQRKYMVVLMKHLEPRQLHAVDVLSRKPSEYPHVHKQFRKVLLRVLDKWMRVISEQGKQPQPDNNYFLPNGLLNPTFEAFLDKLDVSYPVMFCEGFGIRGRTMTEQQFFEQMETFDPNFSENFKRFKMSYSQGEAVDENFKFGDPFSWHFCENVAKGLPLNLHTVAVSTQSFGEGTGTAGALIRIGDGEHYEIDALLTAAHVPFLFLDRRTEQRELTRRFNDVCTFASYVREKTFENDYAIVPAIPEFFSLKNGKFVIGGQDKTFGNLESKLYSMWTDLNRKCFGYEVFKRGITTGVTRGILESLNRFGVFEVIGVNEKFSDAGDSGSLVFVESHSGELLPLGVHYASDGNKSLIVPLWRVLNDYCIKNSLLKVSFEIKNPRVDGKAIFNSDALAQMEIGGGGGGGGGGGSGDGDGGEGDGSGGDQEQQAAEEEEDNDYQLPVYFEEEEERESGSQTPSEAL